MRHGRRRFVILTALLCMTVAPASAQQQLYNNWNTATCNVTDVAGFNVPGPTLVQRIDIWFRWRANETTIGYTVSRNGEVIATGDLSRAECDPHQAAWCVARVEPNAQLEAGTYVFRTSRPDICQNAGSAGVGFIRAFGTVQ